MKTLFYNPNEFDVKPSPLVKEGTILIGKLDDPYYVFSPAIDITRESDRLVSNTIRLGKEHGAN